MRHVIYLDTLVFLNSVITYILLLSARQFCCAKTSAGRLIAAGFLGGLSSCLILLPEAGFLLTVLLQTSVGALISFCAFFVSDAKKYLRCFAVFTGMTYCYGGFMYALSVVWDGFVRYRNGFGYIDFGFWGILTIVCVLYLLIKLLKRKFVSGNNHLLYHIEIFRGGRSVRGKAILDTGHFLTDCYTGQPVIVVERKFTHGILSSEETEELNAAAAYSAYLQTPRLKVRLLPVDTVAGKRFLPAFSCDRAVIKNEDRYVSVNAVSVAVTDILFREIGCSALINETIFE